MPTGYTAPVVEDDDITFHDFVWRCTRAMGVRIMERDDPITNEPPQEKPDSQIEYHANGLEEAKQKRAKYEQMSKADLDAKSAESFAEGALREEESVKRQTRELDLSLAMLERVKGWTPPTADHEGFKKFMIEQLETGTRPIYRTERAAEALSAEEYRAFLLKSADRDIEYHADYLAKAKANAEERKLWIESLRKSLEDEAPEWKPTLGD
jgi:hypothetical protein